MSALWFDRVIVNATVMIATVMTIRSNKAPPAPLTHIEYLGERWLELLAGALMDGFIWGLLICGGPLIGITEEVRC
jgi:hypothetical protein